MGSKRRQAREAAQFRSDGEIWIDHAAIREEDTDWLGDVEWFTLWNVTTPPGFLATLPALWGRRPARRVGGCSGL